MTISVEYLQEFILRDWAENLWLLNNASVNPNAPRYDRLKDLHEQFYESVRNNAPQGAKALSARGFTLLCWGMVGVGTVAPKTADRMSSNKLVDAWRNSVLRNHFQSRYDVFDTLLKETVDRFGTAAAIAQYPANANASPNDVADVFARVNYASRNFAAGEVASMIRKAGNPPAAPAATKGGPKA